ncbi:DUF3861 family protein [Solidesulfovibrio sp.]|uniref:DUF3861 family protein n=1 Tax=Solidesulfovibrio sp. TaxID=2910990 RepID=UPI0026170320|nr:DUF3861 family protein [Solidesulfovibrio sp.]
MAMHRYDITVEEAQGERRRLACEASSHDDLMALAGTVVADDPRALRLLLGAKLLGGVLLEDRDNPLYKDFLPQFGAFMRALKGAWRTELRAGSFQSSNTARSA